MNAVSKGKACPMTIRTDWPKYAAASGTHEKVLSVIADWFRNWRT
jgi:hypothetical protein